MHLRARGAAGSGWVCRMREVLEFERLTPEPGPDADAVRHEYVARLSADVDGVLEVGGIATVWDLLVDGVVVRVGAVGVRAARWSTWRPASTRCGSSCIRSASCSRSCRPSRGSAGGPCWSRTPSCAGCAPRCSAGRPASRPGRRWSGPTGRSRSARGARVLKAWLEGTTGVVEVDGERVEYPDAELWWPHTHGTPHLHDVVVDGEVVGRVGFRTVENRSTDGSLDLWVNGVRVFCRGAVWTPGAARAPSTRRSALGLNLVRVPGIAAYESDEFHERCDELGLLVWQDLMFATFDYPLADPEFAATVTAEVADQCARWLGAPVHRRGVRLGRARAAGGDVRGQPVDRVRRRARRAAPAGRRGVRDRRGLGGLLAVGRRPGGPGRHRHRAVLRRRRLPARPARRAARAGGFAAECLAFSNLPDPVVEGGVPQDNGADWDFADVREHYLRQRYGASVAADGPEAQRVTGEVMADVFGEWRRPGSGCGGGIVLWLRDVVPGAGWGLLDHAGTPKPAALALAPTLQPTAVWFVDEGLNGLDVHVAHDGPEPLAGTLEVALLREDGSAGESASVELSLDAHGHHRVSVEALLGRFADVSYAYRFGPPQHAGVRATFGSCEAVWTVPLGVAPVTGGARYALEFTEDPRQFLRRAGALLEADPVLGTVVASVTARAITSADAGEPLPHHAALVADRRRRGHRRAGRRRDADRAVPAVPPLRAAAAGRRRAPGGRGAGRARRGGRRAERRAARRRGARHRAGAADRPPRAGARAHPAARARAAGGAARRAGRPPAGRRTGATPRWPCRGSGPSTPTPRSRPGGWTRSPRSSTSAEVDQRIAEGRIWLWEDHRGTPVSLVGFNAPSYGVARVGPVYTPGAAARPRLRQRADRARVAAAARRRLAGLPVHRPGQPDLEQDLRGDRLRAGRGHGEHAGHHTSTGLTTVPAVTSSTARLISSAG